MQKSERMAQKSEELVLHVGVIKHARRRKRSRTLYLFFCPRLIVLVTGFLRLSSHRGQFLVLTYRIRQLGICRNAPKPSSRDKSTENICSGLVSLRHLFTIVD